jgi:phosphoribosyl-dephospho-CoA transferase
MENALVQKVMHEFIHAYRRELVSLNGTMEIEEPMKSDALSCTVMNHILSVLETNLMEGINN